MKLSVKLPLIAFILGGIIGAIFLATQIVTSQQKSDGLVINIAGRQRALSQKMTKEAFSALAEPQHLKILLLSKNCSNLL